jgi:hypothetical protein
MNLAVIAIHLAKKKPKNPAKMLLMQEPFIDTTAYSFGYGDANKKRDDFYNFYSHHEFLSPDHFTRSTLMRSNRCSGESRRKRKLSLRG